MTIEKKWQNVSIVLLVMVLAGMFLPWITGIDLASLAISGRRIMGWNVSWIPITVLIGLISGIGFIFMKAKSLKLLSLVVMLCSCFASLIPIIDLGLVTLRGAGKGSFGTFLVITKFPYVGFWLTLLGMMGMIAIGVFTMIKKINRND